MLSFYSNAFIVDPWRWDMKFEHDVEWLWEEWAGSSNMCLKGKEVLLVLYYIDKNWHYFIKEYLE